MTALFITGTDTDVGKTVISALFMTVAQKVGSVSYHKPIQTGVEHDCDARTIRTLLQCSPSEADFGLGLKRPLSPHLAAAYEGIAIDFSSVVKKARASMLADLSLIEGAGGVLVPITKRHLMLDLIKALDIPTVIVARSSLGTINHTLLTIETLRAHHIPIRGVVMVGDANPDNEASVATYGKIELVVSIPRLPTVDKTQLEALAARKKTLIERFW